MNKKLSYVIGVLIVTASFAVLKTCAVSRTPPPAAQEGPAPSSGSTLDSMYQEGTDKAIMDMIKQRER